MQSVNSRDGTTIVFDRSGAGPSLILVGGGLEYRALDSETSRLEVEPDALAPVLVEFFGSMQPR